MTETFHPWRRRVDFLPCEEAPIIDLIEQLDLIRDKRRWGFVFRRGLFEIGEADFSRIARAMAAPIAAGAERVAGDQATEGGRESDQARASAKPA